MNWLPSLSAWPFALAGVAGAITTVLIHLLNWHRHRVIEWGAIEFLREAVKRNRRIVQVRDVVLLVLRTLAVLLFGLALARPHYSGTDTLAGLQPIHAILIVDNSLSMSYETLDGSLLDRAKRAAVEAIQRLPRGSQVSVIPACGWELQSAKEPVTNPREAALLVNRIQIADRAAGMRQVFEAGQKAASFAPDLPKEVVFFTDQQSVTWEDLPDAEKADDLSSIQVVDVLPGDRENTWIGELQVRDGFAVEHSSTRIDVEIRRTGGQAAHDLEVTLFVKEQPVASKSVELTSTQPSQQVSFQHRFDADSADVSEPTMTPIKIAITADRLSTDDEQLATVSVLPVFPIVFVDQFGAEGEDVLRGWIGETRSLRRLLRAAVNDRLPVGELPFRSLAISDLDASDLVDARLVVVAGVREPLNTVRMLHEFVERGGQLLIAAGGEFNPELWNAQAWQDGAGILPLPLAGTIGSTPDETRGELRPFALSFEGLANHAYFQLPGSSEQELRELYAEPFFFQAVTVNEKVLETSDTPARVVARFANEDETPFLVEREIGRGRVILLSSSLTGDWNTLPKTNAVVMLDRIARDMVRSTLPTPVADNRSDRDLRESDLAKVDQQTIAEFAKTFDIHLVRSGEEISLGGTQAVGQHLWWWLSAVVFVLAVAELTVLAVFNRSRGTTPKTGVAS
jgi:hypothetical protein